MMMKMKTLAALLSGEFARKSFGEDTGANSGFTGCFGKAGLAQATTASQIKTAAPNGAGTDYAIHGIAYEKADTDNMAATLAAVQAADTKCLYIVMMDSAGNLTTVKGKEQLTTDVAAGRAALQWPQMDSKDKCAIGGFRVVTVAVTFTLTVTNFNAAGVTTTFFDFMGGLPSQPLTS